MALDGDAVRSPTVMRNVMAALLAAGSACLGASTASAGVEDEDVSVSLDPASVDAGRLFSAVLIGCVDGQNVTFSVVPGDAKNSPCIGDDGDGSVGSANAEFLSPDDPGTYIVMGEVLETAATASAQLTVVTGEEPGPELADTGSASGPMVPIAVAAVAIGLGLVGVVRFRR